MKVEPEHTPDKCAPTRAHRGASQEEHDRWHVGSRETAAVGRGDARRRRADPGVYGAVSPAGVPNHRTRVGAT
jgi:hypothetical protein